VGDSQPCLANGIKGDVKIGEGEDQGTFLMDGTIDNPGGSKHDEEDRGHEKG
jgi:hypothetical protein